MTTYLVRRALLGILAVWLVLRLALRLLLLLVLLLWRLLLLMLLLLLVLLLRLLLLLLLLVLAWRRRSPLSIALLWLGRRRRRWSLIRLPLAGLAGLWIVHGCDVSAFLRVFESRYRASLEAAPKSGQSRVSKDALRDARDEAEVVRSKARAETQSIARPKLTVQCLVVAVKVRRWNYLRDGDVEGKGRG